MADDVRKLYRSKNQRMLGGVCGGLGHYFHVDPTLVRLIVITFTFLIPFLPLAYLILWIIVPDEPEATVMSPMQSSEDQVIDAEVKD